MTRLFLRHQMVFFLWGLSACTAGRYEQGVFRKEGVAYTVAAPQAWRELRFRDNDVAFVDASQRFLLAINSTCEGHDDAPLKVLLRDLLLGFEHRTLLAQEEWMLDGRAALSARYHATLDGVPTDMALTVLKKNGCVYDFVYLAPRGHFEEGKARYLEVLSRFKTEVP